MAKPKKDDGHRMGKTCGYTIEPDGAIVIAPLYATQFERISDERSAVFAILDHFQTILMATEEKQRMLWARIADDYSIDLEKYSASYRHPSRRVYLTPRAEKPE